MRPVGCTNTQQGILVPVQEISEGGISGWGLVRGKITGRKNSPGRENNVGKGVAEESGPGAWHRRRRKCIWFTQSQGVGGKV